MKTRQIFTWVAILAVLVPSMTFAQNSEARFGTDSATCVINLSLYREFAKQKNYKDAYKPWKWVYHNCPRAMQSIYLDGLRIMDSRLQHEKNVEKRNHTIDTILMIYDGRIKYFPVNTSTGKSQEGYLLGRKGMDAFLYRQDKPEEAFNILKSAVEIDGKETPIDVMQFYFNSVVAMVQKGSVDKSAIVDVYDQLSEMLENSINAETDSTVLNELYFARNNVENLFEPFATCEDLVSIYRPKFDASPNDLSLLKKITKIFSKKTLKKSTPIKVTKGMSPKEAVSIMGNPKSVSNNSNNETVYFYEGSELFFKNGLLDFWREDAKASLQDCTNDELFYLATENLHKLEPSANSAYLMAIKNMKEENYPQAIDYLKEALSLYDTKDKKARAHYLLGSIYLNQRNYSAAKAAALKVLELKPNDGSALILIGDAYAVGAASCGDNELTKKAAYWASVDKYIQAKRVDPSVLEIAEKRISSYSQYYPTTETIFFHGLKEGDSYRVECWINETTTIRAAK